MQEDVIKSIIVSHSIKEIEKNIKSFLKFVDENRSLKIKLCRRLANEVKTFTDVHHLDHYYTPCNNKNVIVLSEQQSPLYYLRTYIGGMKQVKIIIDKLYAFMKQCEEFIEPTNISITNEEIDLVIDIANSKYKILDILAPVNPLIVLQFNNTNKIWNSQCGITTKNNAVLLIYHPKNEKGNDPVYIFAHELGHAVHIALTNDVTIMPSKFDDMNEALGLKTDIPNSEKTELFADVFAMAVLNCPQLKLHDPFVELNYLVPVFDRYITYLLSV